MKLKSLAILLAILGGMSATACSNPCDDLDCSADACADPAMALDKAICEGLVEADDGDACDAYTGCGK